MQWLEEEDLDCRGHTLPSKPDAGSLSNSSSSKMKKLDDKDSFFVLRGVGEPSRLTDAIIDAGARVSRRVSQKQEDLVDEVVLTGRDAEG